MSDLFFNESEGNTSPTPSAFGLEPMQRVENRFARDLNLDTPPSSPVNPRQLNNSPEASDAEDVDFDVPVLQFNGEEPVAPAAPLRGLGKGGVKRAKVLKPAIDRISQN